MYHRNCGSHHHKRMFLKAVYQCLQVYLGQNITSISMVSCLGEQYATHYSRWMQYIAAFGVQKILFKLCSSVYDDEYGSYSVVEYFPLPFQMLLKHHH